MSKLAPLQTPNLLTAVMVLRGKAGETKSWIPLQTTYCEFFLDINCGHNFTVKMKLAKGQHGKNLVCSNIEVDIWKYIMEKMNFLKSSQYMHIWDAFPFLKK